MYGTFMRIGALLLLIYSTTLSADPFSPLVTLGALPYKAGRWLVFSIYFPLVEPAHYHAQASRAKGLGGK